MAYIYDREFRMGIAEKGGAMHTLFTKKLVARYNPLDHYNICSFFLLL